MRKSTLYVLGWAAIIAALSFTPGNYIPKVEWSLLAPDTIAHFLFYGIFTVLIHFDRYKRNNYWLMVLLLPFVFGTMVEVVQGLFIPGRFFDYWDILSNSIGHILAIIVLYIKKGD